jgi:hypothetical protein
LKLRLAFHVGYSYLEMDLSQTQKNTHLRYIKRDHAMARNLCMLETASLTTPKEKMNNCSGAYIDDKLPSALSASETPLHIPTQTTRDTTRIGNGLGCIDDFLHQEGRINVGSLGSVTLHLS